MPQTTRQPTCRHRRPDLGLVDALAQLTFAVQGALGRIAAATRAVDRPDPAARDPAGPPADDQGTGGVPSARQVERHRTRGPSPRARAGPTDGLDARWSKRARAASPPPVRALIDRDAVAAFEDEIAVLVSDLTPTRTCPPLGPREPRGDRRCQATRRRRCLRRDCDPRLVRSPDPPAGGNQVGGTPLVVGASPCCCAMIAASTTCRSDGSIANGPPATGTCQTWVIIGVAP